MPWVVTSHTVKYGGRFYTAGQKFKVEDEYLHLIPDAVEVDGRNGRPKELMIEGERPNTRGRKPKTL